MLEHVHVAVAVVVADVVVAAVGFAINCNSMRKGQALACSR